MDENWQKRAVAQFKNIIIKVEVKLDIETDLIIGINTLLDTVSITL